MSDERVPDQTEESTSEFSLNEAVVVVAQEPDPSDSATLVPDNEEMPPISEIDVDLSMDDLARYAPMQAGQVVTGTVMRVDRDGVLVDVGAKSEGIIRPHELSRDPNTNPEDVVKVGETIRVFVVDPEGAEGNPILSKKRADFEQAWEKVKIAARTKATLQAVVLERVKGGLRVDVGIPGFVPASHVGTGGPKVNLDKYVGQTIPLKVLEVDRDHRKVILSNKMAVEEDRVAKSEETRNSLTPGSKRRGQVRRITSYGAFVDLGGIDGLLHISEMSWTRINDPHEVLREGQEIEVMILKIDPEQNRVSLGLRQTQPDPWIEISSRYAEGNIITGTVTRVVPFGAFIQVEGGVEGIIPNSEMARNRGGRGTVVLSQGEQVEVKLISLRPEERKMTLSMRALAPVEEVVPVPQIPQDVPAVPKEGAREPSKRERRGPREDDRSDFGRPSSKQEEPRFTIGDAFEAAQKQRDRSKQERRVARMEEDDNLEDLAIELDTEELED